MTFAVTTHQIAARVGPTPSPAELVPCVRRGDGLALKRTVGARPYVIKAESWFDAPIPPDTLVGLDDGDGRPTIAAVFGRSVR